MTKHVFSGLLLDRYRTHVEHAEPIRIVIDKRLAYVTAAHFPDRSSFPSDLGQFSVNDLST